ncbi:hypothetical protein Hanom_Chr12g01130851 [Helianthus anomalus]
MNREEKGQRREIRTEEAQPGCLFWVKKHDSQKRLKRKYVPNPSPHSPGVAYLSPCCVWRLKRAF